MPRCIGQVATSAVTEVQVTATTITEVTTSAQRSVKSSSANDAAAGTGARTVRIHYYSLDANNVMTGPFSEDLTLNGVTAVATVATNITFIERIEILTAGAGGVAAGNIGVYPANDGTGTAIALLATGAVRSLLGHHYVPSGKQCEVTDLEGIGGDAAAALLQLKVQRYPVASFVEQPITGQAGVTSTLPRTVPMGPPGSVRVAGPARVRLMVTPANVNAQTTRASFGYVDR